MFIINLKLLTCFIFSLSYTDSKMLRIPFLIVCVFVFLLDTMESTETCWSSSAFRKRIDNVCACKKKTMKQVYKHNISKDSFEKDAIYKQETVIFFLK